MAGLELASQSLVVMMDDDLQHAPEDIPLLIEAIEKGYDVVYANFLKKQHSRIKNLGSWLNDKLAQLIVNKPAGLYLSPFKILRQEVVQEVVKYNGPFPYIDGLLFQITSSFHQIPLPHYKRKEGEGNHGIYRSLRIVFNFCTTFSVLPLRISTLVGLVISILACLYGIVLIIWKTWFGIVAEEGWTTIMLGIMIMGGIQLVGIGVLGEYMGRAYMSINRRPQYIIKEKLAGPDLESSDSDTAH